MASSRGLYLGHYIYARELGNGEWTLYEGSWSAMSLNSTTNLAVMRCGGKPIRFALLEEAKEYVKYRYGSITKST